MGSKGVLQAGERGFTGTRTAVVTPVSQDTCLLNEEPRAVGALGSVEVVEPLLRDGEGPVSGGGQVVLLVVLPVGREVPCGLSSRAVGEGA